MVWRMLKKIAADAVLRFGGHSGVTGDCCLHNRSVGPQWLVGFLGNQFHRTEPPQLPFKALMRIDALAEAGVADLDCAEDYVVSVI